MSLLVVESGLSNEVISSEVGLVSNVSDVSSMVQSSGQVVEVVDVGSVVVHVIVMVRSEVLGRGLGDRVTVQ